jgi:hypothetical protein
MAQAAGGRRQAAGGRRQAMLIFELLLSNEITICYS